MKIGRVLFWEHSEVLERYNGNLQESVWFYKKIIFVDSFVSDRFVYNTTKLILAILLFDSVLFPHTKVSGYFIRAYHTYYYGVNTGSCNLLFRSRYLVPANPSHISFTRRTSPSANGITVCSSDHPGFFFGLRLPGYVKCLYSHTTLLMMKTLSTRYDHVFV